MELCPNYIYFKHGQVSSTLGGQEGYDQGSSIGGEGTPYPPGERQLTQQNQLNQGFFTTHRGVYNFVVPN